MYPCSSTAVQGAANPPPPLLESLKTYSTEYRLMVEKDMVTLNNIFDF